MSFWCPNILEALYKKSKDKNKCTDRVFFLDNSKLCFAIGKWNFNLERLVSCSQFKSDRAKVNSGPGKFNLLVILGQSLEGTYSIWESLSVEEMIADLI